MSQSKREWSEVEEGREVTGRGGEVEGEESGGKRQRVEEEKEKEEEGGRSRAQAVVSVSTRDKLDAIVNREEEVPTVLFHAVCVPPRNTGLVLKLLNTSCPLREEDGFLKRIRSYLDADGDKRVEVLVQRVQGNDGERQALDDVTPNLMELCLTSMDGQEEEEEEEEKEEEGMHVEGLEGQQLLKRRSVPARLPYNRREWELWQRLWPCKWLPAQMQVELPMLSTEEVERAESFMRVAVDMARLGASKGQQPIGCCIVDSHGQTDVVVACDYDHTGCGDDSHPLSHAVMRCIGLVSTRDLALYKEGEMMEGMQHSFADKPYLCTGLEVYVTREPCLMCSMALTHSRVARVVYGSSMQGPLGGYEHAQVHTNEQLNHRYDVWRGVLQDECDALWGSTD